jgi:hypothetical protein
MGEELFLIYINEVGKNYKGEYIYEFLFSDTIDGIDGEGWDSFPAVSGKPEPPQEHFIKRVGTMISNTLNLDLIQHSSVYALWDAVDNIVCLAWENISDYDTYPDKRLAFMFGEPMQTTIDKLYEKDITLEFVESKKCKK